MSECPFEGIDDQDDGEAFKAMFPKSLPRILIEILISLDVKAAQARTVCVDAFAHGVSFQEELLSQKLVDEERYFAKLAEYSGFPFQQNIRPERLFCGLRPFESLLSMPQNKFSVLYQEDDGVVNYLISPDAESVAGLKRFLKNYPNLEPRVRIVAPTRLREMLLERSKKTLIDKAVNRLFSADPDMSARISIAASQASGLVFLLLSFVFGLWFYPSETLMVFHVAGSVFFLMCLALRFFAIPWSKVTKIVPKGLVDFRLVPRYTVLVALHNEANMVESLVSSLSKLRWPKSKLEIKLVCEEDDQGTLDALARLDLPAYFEVIKVPNIGPRTKPKALNYALQATRGEFIVLYDAEDRPDPEQLVEAWRRFICNDSSLGCLQAPLIIANASTNFLTLMFAFEYAALFRGLLPWLADRDLFVPLGGTSNHFRRDALLKAGGWDPFNVTEDADLGLRLRRLGYRIETMSSPTFEDAPETFFVWRRQRTRWFKGWIQCWFVHTRKPVKFIKKVGLKGFLTCQLILMGNVVSALVYPFIFFFTIGLIVQALAMEDLSLYQSILFVVDITNLILAFVVNYVLGQCSLRAMERHEGDVSLYMIPLYWLCLAIPAWCAVFEFIFAPHYWAKTPHKAYRKNITT